LGFVPPNRLLEVVTRIVELQPDHGNRGDRSRAGLKCVVENWGIERVKAEIETRLGWELVVAPPVCFHHGERHLGWHDQNEPARWDVGIFVENGRIKDTEGCPMLTGLREIVRRFRPAVRLTPLQDLILSGIPEEKVEAVRAALKDYRIPTEKHLSNLRRRRSRKIDHLCSERVDPIEIRPCHAAGHGGSRQHPRRRRVSPSF